MDPNIHEVGYQSDKVYTVHRQIDSPKNRTISYPTIHSKPSSHMHDLKVIESNIQPGLDEQVYIHSQPASYHINNPPHLLELLLRKLNLPRRPVLFYSFQLGCSRNDNHALSNDPCKRNMWRGDAVFGGGFFISSIVFWQNEGFRWSSLFSNC